MLQGVLLFLPLEFYIQKINNLSVNDLMFSLSVRHINILFIPVLSKPAAFIHTCQFYLTYVFQSHNNTLHDSY
jgi:monomeric isocitrate dehydrogenase